MKNILIIALLAIGGTSAARVRRIVGGEPIPIERASFYVSIMWENWHRCGGALLSRKHVLTAHSCVWDEMTDQPAGFSVLIATDLRRRDAVGRKIAHVRRPFGVEGALGPEMGIAILTLSESIPLNENAVPIGLPIENVPDAGNAQSPASLTAQLIAIKGRIAPFADEPLKQCQVSVRRCSPFNLLCGKPEGAEMTSGDQGSPLVHNGRIIGIALDHKMIMGSNNVYVDVHSYWEFILKVLYNIRSAEKGRRTSVESIGKPPRFYSNVA